MRTAHTLYAFPFLDRYPKLKRLVALKNALVTSVAHPPTFLRADLRQSLGPPSNASRRNLSGPRGAASALQGENSGASGTITPAGVLGSAPSRESFHLASLLPIKYDALLIDPPLEIYEWESPTSAVDTGPGTGGTWSWADVAALPVPLLAAKESFVFLWVGSGAGDGLERGREVLARWGYR